MAKKLTLLSVAMLLAGITTKAQSLPCGFDAVHKKTLVSSHGYEKAVRTINNRWIESVLIKSKAKLTETPEGYVYEVPIVVHVLHTGGAIGSIYNPDSMRLADMVDYLNKAYAAQAPFPDSTTGPLGGGTRIPLKFVLAKRNPAGLATNGINRIDMSATANYVNFGANADSVRGLNPEAIAALSRWNPSDYYNVYVVNKIDSNDLTRRGGIAGFAYFPGAPDRDGMYVVATQARSGSTTIAHEFGHAYSLYHTFEGDMGGGSCPTETNCATQNDMVCDTEPHKRSSSFAPDPWCPPTDANPCTFGASYNNVQHNIMDYTQCPPDRFTKGQRDRVLSVIQDERSGYKTSAGLLEPSGTVTAACTPAVSGGFGANVGPVRVMFNDLNVWTGDMFREQLAYIDHAYTQQTQLDKGVPYGISVLTENNRQNVKVYIDLNNDGDFTDAGEEVFSHNGTSAAGADEVHSGTITIPSTATTCQWLRMRVVSAFTSMTTANFPCGPYSTNAQAEDYAIYVKNRTAADTVTIALTDGTNPSCLGSSVTFTATPKAGTPTYKWFINGIENGITTKTFTTTALADNDVVTVRTYFTGSCGADSALSNAITMNVASTISAKAALAMPKGTNPGCAGLDFVFKAEVVSGGPTPQFQWKLNGANVGANVDTYATNTLVAGDKIWCIVTPNSSCSTTPVNSDTITITYGTVEPKAQLQLLTANPGCEGDTVKVRAMTIDAGLTPGYTWFINGVEQPGPGAEIFTSTTLNNNDTIRCRVIANHPCIVPGVGDTVITDSVIILRNPLIAPTLDIAVTYGSNPGCIDSLLEFTATYSDGGGSPNVIWYLNGSIAAYGPIYSSAAFNDNDEVSCKLEATPGACNTVDSLVVGPIVVKRFSVPPTPVISLIVNMLVSSVSSDIQWYGPDGLIPGATSGTYHPTKVGNYYAVSNNGGCLSPKSNVLNIALLSVSPDNMSELSIYPNPTSGNVTLDWGGNRVNATIDVFTLTGQKVYTITAEQESRKAMDLSALANGNYVIVIHDQDGKTGTVKITLSR